MNALLKIATITNLIAEIGDCDEIHFTLDGFIKVITDLKTAKNSIPEPPKNEIVVLVEPESDDDDEDNIVPCKCNSTFDIRCLCCPVKSHKQFQNCPERFKLTYECIKNDYDKYKDIDASFTRQDKHNKIFQYARDEPYFLTDDDLEDELLYLIEQDEENEEQYLCYYCDDFVSNAEEQDGAEWNDDRMVCCSCISDHKCEECEEFYEKDALKVICDNLYCYNCETPKNCEVLGNEINEIITNLEDDDKKLEMLEKIKNIIAEYYKS
jgi:hypothetical protein